MKLRLFLLTAMAAALAASPAQGAGLIANKACYREGDPRDPVIFAGGFFTPRGTVEISRDGLPIGTLEASSAGTVAGLLTRPPIIDPRRERPFTLVATDRANPALTGTLTRLVSRLEVTVRPTRGRPSARRRITGRGFTGGTTLYAHVVRGRSVHNVRIGRLAGVCGTVTSKRRIFRERTRNGTYRVQFDTGRRYSPTAYPSVRFRVRIFTVPRGAGAASASAGWTRID